MKKRLKRLAASPMLFISRAAAQTDIRTPSQDGFIGLMLQYPNQISGGILGYLLLAAIFTLSFVPGIKGSGDIMKSYLAAGFITMGASIFLVAFKIVPAQAFIAATLSYILGLALIGR